MQKLRDRMLRWPIERWIAIAAAAIAVAGTIYSYSKGYIVAYGDAESHLNIAKRVIDSVTPGLAQLGGIWLPLPHVLLVPFVYSDFLWRSGLAGSIVSGIAFVISSLYIYKLAHLLTRHKLASVFAAGVFMTNPNIIYMQSTPMTELTLIVFFVMSSYYFLNYLHDRTKLSNLIFAAFFGFCASLSRYDGWALVLMEAGILALYFIPWKRMTRAGWSMLEGRMIIFSALAFFGIALWLVWGFMILGDALYFTHSQFSAKSQQNSWYLRGELPSYRNLPSSLSYYSVTSVVNVGAIATVAGIIGLAAFALDRRNKHRLFAVLLLGVPYFFNVATLYLGQSVIFIPNLTPSSFEWKLFNVRYGLMMVPAMAIFAGYLFYRIAGRMKARTALAIGTAIVVLQSSLYATAYADVITLDDGVRGLSSVIAKQRDAEVWFAKNYDHGMVLLDDFSKSISIIRTPVEMKDIIYIGNKPYWEESLKAPEKYARWIILQQGDEVWKDIWENPALQARLFTYFEKVYTSDEILIFRRIND